MTEEEYKKTNREKTQEAKKSLFWCPKCDANLIGQHGKCDVCGYKEEGKIKI